MPKKPKISPQTYERFAFNKLVRDKVVDETLAEGCRPAWRFLSPAEHKTALLDKLIEETKEVRAAKNTTDVCKELADVMEVLLALARLNGMTPADLETARQAKFASKGGFMEGIYIATQDIPTDHYEIQDFLGQPEKYPHLGQFT